MKNTWILILAAMLPLTTGCGKAKFSAKKQEVLSKSSVLGESTPNLTEGLSDEVNGALPSVGAQIPIPNPTKGFDQSYDVYPVGLDNRIPLTRNCTDYNSNNVWVVTAQSLNLKIYQGSTVVCTSTDSNKIRTQIDAGSFDIASLCPGVNMSGKSVQLELKNQLGEPLNSYLVVYYTDNPDIDAVNTHSSPAVYDKCMDKSSPLFVDLRSSGGAFQLTSPYDGVRFDIQGENAKPVAHTKKQIGWFKNSAMAMLVMPDAKKKVNGINELFGDNTRGPDGEFADNGFAALAKHDENRDSSIDAKDSVYPKLSLWIDRDLNGVAGPGEMLSLSFLSIDAIDLEYDPNFHEEDIFGNEVKYKSVVHFRDGSMKLIYDLWFVTVQ